MYFVKYGEAYLHDPRVNGCMLIDLSFDAEENGCGYCDFSIYPTHPLHGKLKERDADNPIVVYDDDTVLFYGFIYELGAEFYQNGQVKCMGELGFLNESIVRPYATLPNGYGDGHQSPTSVDGYFEWLIAQHNNQVKDNKRFTVGINQGSALDTNNYIYRTSTEYPTTWDEINDKLLTELGGCIRTRHENGVRYIDYLSEWTDTNAQILDFGQNLTDYTQTDDSDNIATFVIPLGAKMSETEYPYDDGYYKTTDTKMDPDKEYYTKSDSGYQKCRDDVTSFETGVTYYEYFELYDESNLPLTIDDLDDGEYDTGYRKSGDIICCESAVEKYGWIGAKYENNDITTKEQLVSKSIVALKELISPKRTIEIKAIDMHLVNEEIKPIRIGEYVRIRSKPHNLDSYFLCTSVELDLNNPQNSKYTFGTTFDTLTGQQNKRIKLLNDSINQTYEQAAKLTDQEKQNAISVGEALKRSKVAHSTATAAKEAADSAVITLADEYSVNDSSMEAPETGWSVDTPEWTEGHYIWRRVVSTYGDGHSETGSPALMTGNTGSTGTSVAIETTSVTYQVGDSGTTQPTGEWVLDIPDVPEGKYLWTKTDVTYSDGNSTTSYSVSYSGKNGSNGADAITLDITASNGFVFKNNNQNTVLTANVYYGGVKQTIGDDGVCGSLGIVKWYTGLDIAAAVAGPSCTVLSKDVSDDCLVINAVLINGEDSSANNTITIFKSIEIESYKRYYLLQDSELTVPSKPTSYPPISPWSETEPSYVGGSNDVLYFVDLTIFSDDSFSYSEVSISTSYEAAKDAWNKAEEAKKNVDNLEIGGRNLLRETGIPKTHTGTGGTDQTTYLYDLSEYYAGNSPISGRTLTLSFEWESTATAGTFYVLLNDSPFIALSDTITVDESNKAGKHIRIMTASSGFDSGTYTGVSVRSNNLAGTVTLKNMKLEFGNACTDWTAAPEDTGSRFTEVETRVTNAETSISNNQNEINARATIETVTELSNKTNDLDSALEDASALIRENRDAIATLTARDFKVEFTTITNQIESLNGDLTSYKEEIGNWMRFDADGNLVLGATKVAGQDSYELKLTKNRISFMLNDNEVAYISSNQLYITNSTVVQNLKIGRFTWEVRGNGNLGLVWR